MTIHLEFEPEEIDEVVDKLRALQGAASPEGSLTVRLVSVPRPTRLVDAVKLIRELCHCSLKDAKDIVDRLSVVKSGLTAKEARAIKERFSQIDCTVGIV